jgi:hypothetical protein
MLVVPERLFLPKRGMSADGSKPVVDNVNLEMIDADLVKLGGAPRRDVPDWAELKVPQKRITMICTHVRQCGRVPPQATTSQTTCIDKRKGVWGFFGLRILHNFCPLWRNHRRCILLEDGGPFDAPHGLGEGYPTAEESFVWQSHALLPGGYPRPGSPSLPGVTTLETPLRAGDPGT